jgi:hypothetical protein
MPRTLLSIAMILGAILLPLASHSEPLTELQSLKLEVPTSDMMFPPGTERMRSTTTASLVIRLTMC